MSNRNQNKNRRDRANPFAAQTGRQGAQTLRELDAAIYGAIDEDERELMSVEPDGNINIGNFAMTPVGLQVLGEASYDDWQNVGNILRRLDASIQWLIGDWMAFGEHEWGQMYEAVAEAMGYEEKSLRNYTWVAKSVQLSLRKDNLSFSHHALVAGMEPNLQGRWLEFAAANGLSVANLRKAIREAATPEEYEQLLIAAAVIPNIPSRPPAPPPIPDQVKLVENDVRYLISAWHDAPRFEGQLKVETQERARRLIQLGQAMLRRMNGEEVD